MCLITTQKKPKKARKDMLVYKALRECSETIASSVYECHKYILGELYTVQIQQDNDWTAADQDDQAWLTRNYPNWNHGTETELICIGAGYHASTTPKRIQKWFTEPIYECTIPKGSEYYEDATGLIVSNQIIINKKISE